MASFHNTLAVTNQTLIEFESEAKSQDDMVLEVYRKVNKPLCWWEVAGFLQDMNECSLKRSITNLKSRGLLIKTSISVLGLSGKACKKYQLIK